MPTETILLDAYGRPYQPAEKAMPWSLAKGSPLRDREAANQFTLQFGGDGKRGSSRINYQTLRTLAIAYPVARACITKRKDQVMSVDWEIAPRDKKNVSDAVLQRARDYFATAGGLGGPTMRLRHFVSALIEDLLVLDAACLYRQKTRGGDPYALIYFDAATIQLIADEHGFRPQPPKPAYKQVIDGKVRGQWTSDEMIYEMMYPRSCSLYGLPPLECLITTVEAAIRSELWNLEWFTSGNLPEAYMGMPREWTSKQIEEFQLYWNSQLQGNLGERSKMKFGPEGSFKEFRPRGDMQFEKLQQWLADLTCAIFGINPTTIGLAGRTFKYAQEGQMEMSKIWGLGPLLQFFKELFDDILAQEVGEPTLEWQWHDEDEEEGLSKAQSDKVYADIGAITRNEIRQELGMEPIQEGLMDIPFIVTANGPVPLVQTPEMLAEQETQEESRAAEEEAGAPEKPEAESSAVEGKGVPKSQEKADRWALMATDLKHFRRKCLRALEKGRPIPSFAPVALPAAFMADLRKALAEVEDSPQTVRLVLSGAIEQVGELAKRQVAAIA